jgi:hypothetical protein
MTQALLRGSFGKLRTVVIFYMIGTVTGFPVQNALQFTAEQWELIRAFRFEQKIDTEAEASAA